MTRSAATRPAQGPRTPGRAALFVALLLGARSAHADDPLLADTTREFQIVPSDTVGGPGSAAAWMGLQFLVGAAQKPRFDPVPFGVAFGLLPGVELGAALHLPTLDRDIALGKTPELAVSGRVRLMAQHRRRPSITVAFRGTDLLSHPGIVGTATVGIRRRNVHLAGSIGAAVTRGVDGPLGRIEGGVGLELRWRERAHQVFEVAVHAQRLVADGPIEPKVAVQWGLRLLPSGFVSVRPWVGVELARTGPSVGFGATLALTSQDVRVLDLDNDKVGDWIDDCPGEQEDKDGFTDEDGCADLDNDGDGVPDSRDPTPNGGEEMTDRLRGPRALFRVPRPLAEPHPAAPRMTEAEITAQLGAPPPVVAQATTPAPASGGIAPLLPLATTADGGAQPPAVAETPTTVGETATPTETAAGAETPAAAESAASTEGPAGWTPSLDATENGGQGMVLPDGTRIEWRPDGGQVLIQQDGEMIILLEPVTLLSVIEEIDIAPGDGGPDIHFNTVLEEILVEPESLPSLDDVGPPVELLPADAETLIEVESETTPQTEKENSQSRDSAPTESPGEQPKEGPGP